jgi:UDPglucose 6-dehydrogenase
LLKRIYEILKNKIKNKRISFLGVTFKANTDDMRDSSSLKMIPELSKKGAIIKYYDPTGHKIEFKKYKNVQYAKSLSSCLDKADLIIIHTEWNDFKSIDFKKIIKNKKTLIFDMRNLYSPQIMTKNKLIYFSVGRGLK